MSSIPVDTYLNYALSLSQKEIECRKELSKWLPKEIIDSHVHTSTQNQCKSLETSFLSRVSSTFPWFEINKHRKVNRILYPKNKIKMLVFPFPHRGIDHRSSNNYILQQASRDPSIVPILYGLPDQIEYTLSKLRTQKFRGLKMYPAYFSPPAQKIREYFPNRILKHCEEMDIPIILHLPCDIVKCGQELMEMAKKFRDLKIILAHMGLAYLPLKNLKKVFSSMSRYETINVDTAMVTSVKVFKLAINIFGYHRVIYGTDQPLNLIRGKMYYNPNLGIRIVTKYPYHWVDLEEQKKFARYAIGAVHLHWEILLALQKAIQSYGESKDIKNCIFKENAKRVFGLYS